MAHASIRKFPELCGGSVSLQDDDSPDEPGQAHVSILFCGGAVLRASYWRMTGEGGTELSSFDHRQQYGLPKPIDAKGLLREYLDNQTVVEVETNQLSRDLHILFSNGMKLQVFGFTDYEVWELYFPDGAVEYSNHL